MGNSITCNISLRFACVLCPFWEVLIAACELRGTTKWTPLASKVSVVGRHSASPRGQHDWVLWAYTSESYDTCKWVLWAYTKWVLWACTSNFCDTCKWVHRACTSESLGLHKWVFGPAQVSLWACTSESGPAQVSLWACTNESGPAQMSLWACTNESLGRHKWVFGPARMSLWACTSESLSLHKWVLWAYM